MMLALVIDDSNTMRIALREILKELGFSVVEARDGREALKMLEKNTQISFALVDWNMPVMDGYEFICAVRADKNFDKIFLMMVTTQTQMLSVEKALQAGANEYVMKPVTKKMIAEKLNLLGLISQSR